MLAMVTVTTREWDVRITLQMMDRLRCWPQQLVMFVRSRAACLPVSCVGSYRAWVASQPDGRRRRLGRRPGRSAQQETRVLWAQQVDCRRLRHPLSGRVFQAGTLADCSFVLALECIVKTLKMPDAYDGSHSDCAQ